MKFLLYSPSVRLYFALQLVQRFLDTNSIYKWHFVLRLCPVILFFVVGYYLFIFYAFYFEDFYFNNILIVIFDVVPLLYHDLICSYISQSFVAFSPNWPDLCPLFLLFFEWQFIPLIFYYLFVCVYFILFCILLFFFLYFVVLFVLAI